MRVLFPASRTNGTGRANTLSITEAGYVSPPVAGKFFVNKVLSYFTRILLCSERQFWHYRFRAASGGTKYLDVSSVFRYN
ncbi:hypothetical protein ES703_117395 [subsurface metagenome]